MLNGYADLHSFLNDTGGNFQFIFGHSSTISSCTCSNILPLQSGFSQGGRDLQHGDLHDVCGGALDRRVDRFAFLAVFQVDIGRILEHGEITPAPKQGFHITLLCGNLRMPSR
jgi:hypothetical protein